MILVDAHDLTVRRPGRPLFETVSVTVARGERVGVLGINGTGKSTLLRILAGRDEPDAGIIRWGRNVRISFLEQQNKLLSSGTAATAVGRHWQGKALLDALGLTGDLIDADISLLSMGQARRVALAVALAEESDLLILDEPTSHLDLDTTEWLENKLSCFQGGVVLVSHDRRLLAEVTTRVLELREGSIYDYNSYSDYSKARTASAGKPSTSIRCEPLALDLASADRVTPRLGDKVVELHDVDIGYESAPLLIKGLNLTIGRRERLGVVGINGAGKSTLLDVIAGQLAPRAGRIVIGPTARIGYYKQRNNDLPGGLRVFEVVTAPGASAPTWWEAAMLERFWFDADAQRAPVGLLSGGERRRLQLVNILAAAPNVLLLDEPTNDLDLDTLRILEDFLQDWPGALVVASHDRVLLDRVADDVIVVDSTGKADRWPGGYVAWLEHRRKVSNKYRIRSRHDQRKQHDRQRGKPGRLTRKPTPGGRSVSTIRFELRKAENALEKQQDHVVELQAELESATDDYENLARLGEELADAVEQKEKTEDLWLQLSLELEQITTRQRDTC